MIVVIIEKKFKTWYNTRSVGDYMTLQYEELKNRLPKETMEVIDKVLPYLDAYVRNNKSLSFKDADYSSGSMDSLTFYLLLYVMSDDIKIGSFLSSFGFDKERYVFKQNFDLGAPKDVLFLRNSYIVPELKDELDYEDYTPVDLLLYFLREYKNNCSINLFGKMFYKIDGIETFESKLKELNNSIKKEKEHETEQELFSNLPISVINYLETASKIRNILIKKGIKSNTIGKTEDDIDSISMFLAVFYYKDSYKDEDSINKKKLITDYFESKGIRDYLVRETVGLSSSDLSESTIEKSSRNIFAIKRYYSRFFRSGIYDGKDLTKVTIEGLLENVFDRNISHSFAPEKILSELNCNIKDFKNFSKITDNLYQTKKREKQDSYLNSFYQNMNNDTRDFIEFTTRIYTLILNKMNENKVNRKLLNDKDDADTLALFIASYYYNTDVSKFYINNNIPLEKVYELIGFTLTKSEIEDTELSKKTLVDRYKRFVYDGVNKNKTSRELTINDITYNLCDKGFNKTSIMEEIFKSQSSNKKLDDNFLDKLKYELEKNEKLRRIKLAQETFRNSSPEEIEFFERLSKIHKYYKLGTYLNLSEDDVLTINILFTLLNKNSSYRDFFEHQKINTYNLYKYFDTYETDVEKEEYDIDVLVDKYIPFIKRVKELKDKDHIEVYDVAKYVFSKELNDSVQIKKLLNEFHLTYEDFEDFDSLYTKYNIKKQYTGFSYDTDLSIENLFKYYQYFKRKKINKEFENILVFTNEDIIELSLLLTVINGKTGNLKRYFEKNGFTLDKVLEWFKFENEDLERIQKEVVDEVVDYDLINDNFKEYFKDYDDKSSIQFIDIVGNILDKNPSSFMNNLGNAIGGNYYLLKKEIDAKDDIENTLSIDDRISLLERKRIDPIDQNDIGSILKFGNSLTIHSKYIYDELPKLTSSDSNSKSVEVIQELANKVYRREEVKQKNRGIFARLFTFDKEIDSKIVINYDALEELKDVIDDSIEQLSKELLGYDSIRKYLEAYRKKNKYYYETSKRIEDNVQGELSRLNPEDEEEYDRYIQLSSLLQIMRDKTNRFKTTNRIAQQDLIRINQSIANHFITINALEMAKNDLLPLIGSELAMSDGKETEKEALELSRNVIGLFTSLLSRNIGSTKETVELLKASQLPDELFETLNRDIELYIQGIRDTKMISEQPELPKTKESTSVKTKKLVNKNRRNE